MKCKACDRLLTDDDYDLCISCFKIDRETNIDNYDSTVMSNNETISEQLDLITDFNEVDYLPLE